MTHREKIELLKNTITYLYEKEGRSKSYISRLLEVDRRVLTNVINKEWKLTQAQVRHLKPSNQKFLNKHKQLIKSRLDNDVTITDIAKELGVSRHYLTRTIIPADDVLSKAREDYHIRRARKKGVHTKYEVSIRPIVGERWKTILGYPNYKVSDLGRVKSNRTGNKNIWYECQPSTNPLSKREYISLTNDKGTKTYQLHRIVGHAFVGGYSKKRSTINHKNGIVDDNRAVNLEWVSQSENNKHAYDELKRPKNVAYQRYGKFKKIILNDKYEFSTIAALSRFIGKSETQTRRYIDGESKSDYDFKFIY